MRRSLVLSFSAVTAALVFNVGASAQFDTASVIGFVRYAAGANVANAYVTLTNVETGVAQQLQSNKEDKFEFSSVKIGNYRVIAGAPGFSKLNSESFTLSVNARQRVDLVLKSDSINETVTVTTAASLLETESSSHTRDGRCRRVSGIS